MASAMRKMAVYLGLVEDDHRYDEPYADEYGEADDYGDYVTEYSDHAGAPEANGGYVADDGQPPAHIAVKRAVTHGQFALVPGGENHCSRLI